MYHHPIKYIGNMERVIRIINPFSKRVTLDIGRLKREPRHTHGISSLAWSFLNTPIDPIIIRISVNESR